MNTGRLTIAGAICLALAWTTSQASAAENSMDELVGLWAAERDFTPDMQGLLIIRRLEDGLAAEIGDQRVAVSNENGELRFELPDAGYFRGAFSADGTSIRGHWVQPRTLAGFARFASPVTLSKQPDGHWQGVVRPLGDRIHMYVVFRKDEDGSIRAFIRNPEGNLGRFFRIATAVRDGDKIIFRDAQGRDRLLATYDPDEKRISINFFFSNATFDFERVGEGEPSGFYPRPPANPPYRYVPPVPGEGWRTATLEDEGLARKPIEDMIRVIIDTPIDAIDSPDIHAVLVARHGKLVLEEYFHGLSRDKPHATRSAAKSMTTTLVGMAVHEGLIKLDAPVYKTMYDGSPPPGLDPRKARMTLENLITMTPGLACDDSDNDSPGNENTMQSQQDQPDWHQYTLDLEMIHEPGAHAAYCSASQNLAGGVISKASGEWLPEFYRKHFAEPLATGRYAWNLTPAGKGYGGGGLYILPRDFLKLGQLYLNDGVWNGQRLLDPGWVKAATTGYNTINDEGYGYGWWLFSYPYKGREVDAYYAGGNGGQYVIVIPEFDLDIVAFGGNFNQRVMHKFKYEYVRDYVLPAVMGK